GMDVVKKAVDSLRGKMEIDSVPGEGTTITLSLPLTLAIIEGLLVKVGADRFVIPLSIVEECIELTAQTIKESHGRHLVNVRSQIVPYIHLRENFSINGDVPKIQQIVIVNAESRRVGFVVDSVIGQHQTVIKSLGKFYHGVQGISGATILGDGSVALLLDMPQLVRMVETEENV
ncbi:MAG: chemotaxis protein CheW, partial [Nitrospirota bacterium]|nr:chemotaxis protein CheW [Nitrospirota bacterium]